MDISEEHVTSRFQKLNQAEKKKQNEAGSK
jgi:hypothetical protein